MTLHIRDIDPATMSDKELGPLLEVANRLNREAQPRSGDLTAAEFRILTTSPGSVRQRFVAEANGRVLGFGETRYSEDGTNPDRLLVILRVDPEHRRLGIGTSMLARAVATAEDLGRDILQGWVFDSAPAGGEFARTVGAEEKLHHHENVLEVRNLDVDLMQSWIERGRRKAIGYTVEVYDDAWPDGINEGMAHLYYVLERDMPLSEGQEPREWTGELVAQMHAHFLQEAQSVTAVAFAEETGEPVGMSQMIRRNSDPSIWVVTTTMVDPPHRGKSIGKWVKAACNLAALERWPEGVYQETGNAFTNDAMLAINDAMGFEHDITITDVEVPTARARAYLDGRS